MHFNLPGTTVCAPASDVPLFIYAGVFHLQHQEGHQLAAEPDNVSATKEPVVEAYDGPSTLGKVMGADLTLFKCELLPVQHRF